MKRTVGTLLIGIGISGTACGTIPPTGTGGTGGTGGGDGALCPKTCAEAAAVQPSTSENWPCSMEPLCGRVSFSTPPSLVIGPPYTLRTPIEARCTLEALRDGKQGYLFWSAVSNGGPGVSDSWHLFIRPGRIALVKKESYSDFRSEHWLGARKLQDAAYFTDCLSKTGDALYSCFSGAAAPACE